MATPQSGDSYKPIGDYGIIGNRRSAALVGLDGSIDWCCFPRFDSPSVFAAILDAEKGGRFSIAPEGPYTSSQGYVGDSNVLETQFVARDGVCSIIDCMPLYEQGDGDPVQLHRIVRVLRCKEGAVTLRVNCAPRPDYARATVSATEEDGSLTWMSQAEVFTLQAPAAVQVTGYGAGGTLTLHEGQEEVLVFSYVDAASEGVPDALSPRDRVERTVQYWEAKAADLQYDGPWREQVVRSYLVLHLLTYQPTGSIVAAPTTSFPEEIGGVRNWDYRYTWLRDAAFTIDALMALAHHDDAHSFFQWLGRVCAAAGEGLRIMYRVDTDTDLEEEELSHLEGYRRSRPVRIGNGAYTQTQHDVYGEVLASAHLLASTGQAISEAQWDLLSTLADLAAARWQQPDSGIWEVRGGPYHFIHSKVMCWVALDRAVALAKEIGHTGPESEEWERTAHAIKQEVLQRGWSERKQAFVQHYGSEAMDASNLLLPLVGFLPFDDPRVVSTVQRIREELGNKPFLQRYRTEETDDGLAGSEGAFTLCSFWLVRVLAGLGQVEEARQMFQELLGYANHLGLFSEMVDPGTGLALDNFPQAFTHIGLILTARECGMAQDGE